MSTAWDNIQILRAVDRHQERAGGGVAWGVSGLRLMEELAGGTVTEETRWRGFVQELHICRSAGLLTFVDEPSGGSAAVNPDSQPHMYLQVVQNLALTVTGQDRARGRQVAQSWPDVAEDDGRPISGLILREIATAIHEEYDSEQVLDFLGESGVPPASLVPPVGLYQRNVGDVLAWMGSCGSEGRRELRSFIGRWLDNRLITGPDDVLRKKLSGQLARQGWYVQDGRLVVGPPATARLIGSPVLRDARIAALHPCVAEIAAAHYVEGHWMTVVFEVLKAVNNRVKKMTGLDDDGMSLMAKAFGDNGPLVLGDLCTETGMNVQRGCRFLFMGMVQALRNPRAHEQFHDLGEDEALEELAFASLLMRRLDDAEKVPE